MLVLLAEHVKSEGRKFVLANVVAAEASPDHQTRKAWADAQRGRGFAGEEERFRRLAQSGGFEFVGLIEPVLRHIDRTGDDLFYFDYLGRSGGHWNKIGHRVVGMALADRICPFLHADAASS
uniref:Uncharacterized protein n=1 Tax=uncultured marine thaumarchaeote KM3_02_B09 TaxID=1455956 RepID=A0A075G2B7_9ARCH|nr:hypothetical protein [uncultured marine thaumarchaeote KM3_02_B09]